MWFYHPKDADRRANSVEPDQSDLHLVSCALLTIVSLFPENQMSNL